MHALFFYIDQIMLGDIFYAPLQDYSSCWVLYQLYIISIDPSNLLIECSRI